METKWWVHALKFMVVMLIISYGSLILLVKIIAPIANEMMVVEVESPQPDETQDLIAEIKSKDHKIDELNTKLLQEKNVSAVNEYKIDELRYNNLILKLKSIEP